MALSDQVSAGYDKLVRFLLFATTMVANIDYLFFRKYTYEKYLFFVIIFSKIAMTNFIRRAQEQSIANATPPLAVVIIGPRRCGKTTLLKELVKQFSGTVRWFNCDLRKHVQQLQPETTGDVEAILRMSPIIVIDEAQKVPGIGNVLKLLVDANEQRQDPVRLFVTGSSSLQLSCGVKESAVGRFKERKMWPFSMKELADHWNWGYVQEHLENFMIFGCNPQVIQDFDEAPETLINYREGILFRDLLQLVELRRISQLTDLVTKLSYRIGSIINYESLGAEIGLSRLTVQRYIDLLELCNIIKVVPSYSRNLDNEMKKGKKIYFTDLGIRNALIEDFSPFSSRPDAGAIWENFFFMERLKMHDFSLDRKRLFFWRSKENKPKELDFIEVRNQEMQAFECKLSPKAQANPGEAFRKAYPDCPIHVVTPENALRFFGMPSPT